MPKVEIDFTVSRRTTDMMTAMATLRRRVLRKAPATVIYETADNSGTGAHYAGTPGMSADPTPGVVNADIGSHTIDNLYIRDGGVVHTSPDKHPTLTIMASPDRLAAHIAARFAINDLKAA